MYLLRIPQTIRKWMPPGIWEMPPGIQLSVYLTFDDGPHPEATPFVLRQLKEYQAKATFFCVGKNVQEQPEIYKQILSDGHRVGNHTFNHLNGWKTSPVKYQKDIEQASAFINSSLFRPPYGRIRPGQAKVLKTEGMQLVYWSLLSGDFDEDLSPQKCLENVLGHIRPGDVVVFHDSAKAFPRLRYVLPKVLELCRKKGWQLKSL